MAKPPIITPAPLPSSRSSNSPSLPKINRNDVLNATKQVFVQPAVNKVTSGFQQINPANLVRGWAHRNPITSAAMNFGAALEDSRQERDAPNRRERIEAAYRNDGVVPGHVGSQGGGSEILGPKLDTIISVLGMANTELRGLRQSIVTVSRNTNLTVNEVKKTNSILGEIRDAIIAGNTSSLEDKIESRKNTASDAEVGKPQSALSQLIALAASFAASMLARFRSFFTIFRAGLSILSTSVLNFFKGINVSRIFAPIRGALAAFGGNIAGFFRGIKVGEVFGSVTRVFQGIGAGVARGAKLVAPIVEGAKSAFSVMGKVLAPVARIAGFAARLGGLLRFVPVVGQVIMAVFAIFDGLKGFVTGWQQTDGNFFEKLWGGLKGAFVGIVKGIIAPFKWIGDLIWKGIKGIGEALGLDKLVESLKNISFSGLWDKVVGLFQPAGNMFSELWELFKKVILQVVDKFAPGAREVVDNALNLGESVSNGWNSLIDTITGRNKAPDYSNLTYDAGSGGGSGGGKLDLSSIGSGQQGMLDLIAHAEGTTDAHAQRRGYSSGYDVTLGYGKYDPTGNHKPISQMTLNELDAFQTGMLRHPGNSHNSSASGRYQIVQETLRELRGQLGLRGDEIFTPELQDRLARHLMMKKRGGDRYLAGQMSENQFLLNLSREWASLPNPATGRSYYKNNRVNMDLSSVKIGISRLGQSDAPGSTSSGSATGLDLFGLSQSTSPLPDAIAENLALRGIGTSTPLVAGSTRRSSADVIAMSSPLAVLRNSAPPVPIMMNQSLINNNAPRVNNNISTGRAPARYEGRVGNYRF